MIIDVQKARRMAENRHQRTYCLAMIVLALSKIEMNCLQIPTRESSHSTNSVFCKAKVDYSAANEYMSAHYGLYENMKYFLPRSGSSDCVMESIYNARSGVFDYESNALMKPSLDRCGFEVRRAPTCIRDWENIDEIREKYLPELRKLISQAFEGEGISHIIFWHAMRRGTDLNMSHPGVAPPTAPVASLVHIDTDIGAHDNKGLVNLIHNNCMDKDSFPREEIEEEISSEKRFAIVNAWRNIDPFHPVQRSPLALLATQYRENTTCFPGSAPDMRRSRWYTFPDMTFEECLLFKQYDRDIRRPSDLWHCAVSVGEEAGPRKSFDIRAFVVFREKVTKGLDRFDLARIRPDLTLEESGCFCDSQAEKRRTF